MVDFTVAICTYNGESRLSEVLEKLRSQTGLENLAWEILVIDNNSKDNTAEIIRKYQNDWEQTYPLKYFFEAEQGLAFARRCAVKEAQSDLIGFLDDDNLPASDWVAAAFRFAKEHTRAGAYGGQIHGIFEVEPPSGFDRIARFFALIEGKQTYCYNTRYQETRRKMFPPGAGIVVRKQAWQESISDRPRMPQTCEDIELLTEIWQSGWEVWFNAEMHIEHLIPKSRFEERYLVSFFRTNGRYRYDVRMMQCPTWQKPLKIFAYACNDLRKLLVFYLKNCRDLKQDVVLMGEMQLLLFIFLSPILAWRDKLSLANKSEAKA
jgi:glycosyltransferase involved in cell wall biosynthesis